MEQLAQTSRFVYVVYASGVYIVEVNRLHPSKQYTMNVRSEGETLEEAIEALTLKLESLT